MAHDGASGELLDPGVGVGQQRLVNRRATARSDSIGWSAIPEKSQGRPFASRAEAGVSTELAGRSQGTRLDNLSRPASDRSLAMAKRASGVPDHRRALVVPSSSEGRAAATPPITRTQKRASSSNFRRSTPWNATGARSADRTGRASRQREAELRVRRAFTGFQTSSATIRSGSRRTLRRFSRT